MTFNKQKKKPTPIDKFKNISVSKRAFSYMFLMGLMGAVVGTVDSKIVIKQCMDSENCAIENPTEIKISKISMGTCGGMIAATLISIPALLDEEN